MMSDLNKLREELTDLVDKHFPKNNTAAKGGARSPGRGEAMVLVAQAIILVEEYCGGRERLARIDELKIASEENKPGGGLHQPSYYAIDPDYRNERLAQLLHPKPEGEQK